MPAGDGGEALDGPHLARHVAGAGDEDQHGSIVVGAEFRQSDVEVALSLGVRVRDRQPRRPLVRPRQQRRVVHRAEHEDLRLLRQTVSQQVERVRGVAREDGDVVLARADERGDLLPSLLVPPGRQLRRPSRTAMHRTVRAQGRVDGPCGGLQRGSRRAMVEVRVLDDAPVERRDAEIGADRGQGGIGLLRRVRAMIGSRGRLATGPAGVRGLGVVTLGVHDGSPGGYGVSGAGRVARSVAARVGVKDRENGRTGHRGSSNQGPRRRQMARPALADTGAGGGQVVTRSTPPRWRVAVQQAGAVRWNS